jgi:hypothetical protein
MGMAKSKDSKGGYNKAVFEQITLAARQLDAEPSGRLGWIIAFAREDPDTWMPSQWETRGYMLLAFAGYGGANWMAANVSPMSRRDVSALHARVLTTLRELVTAQAGQEIKVPSQGLRTCILRATAPGVKPAIFGVIRRGPFSTMFWQEFADLVLRYGGRLLACRYCGEPFFAERKMLFCSPHHAQQWHDGKKIEHRRKAGTR